MNFFMELPGAIILVYAAIFIWSKLLDQKINYKNYKFYVCLFLLASVSILNYYFVNNFIKITIISVFMVICCYFLFKVGIKKSVVLVIVSQIIFMISDGVIAIVFTFLLNLDTYASNFLISPFIVNVVASIISLILFKILFVKKIYNFMLNKIRKIKNVEVIIMCFTIIIFGNLFTMSIYNKIDFRVIILINMIFTLFCFIVVLYSLKTKNNYNKVYDKYNTTLNSLKEYEIILDKYRVSNHENKNQLLTIRNMLPKSNKKVLSHIDKIIENKLKDDDKIMKETMVIPAGGLRGLIYSKLLYMKDLKINYELLISKNIKTIDFIKLDDELMLDICQIVGVYIDNAIQAVKELRKKHIIIQMYIESNQILISISNNYTGIIDLNRIDEKGYTLKGKEHGYGLALSKQIIDNNKELANEKKITKDVFTQILKIKM